MRSKTWALVILMALGMTTLWVNDASAQFFRRARPYYNNTFVSPRYSYYPSYSYAYPTYSYSYTNPTYQYSYSAYPSAYGYVPSYYGYTQGGSYYYGGAPGYTYPGVIIR